MALPARVLYDLISFGGCMFIKNCWYVAAWDNEIDDGALARRMIANQPILLLRKSNGDIAALADRCSHRFAPLSAGRREGDEIRCMYHGLKFNCEGECVEAPGHDRIPPRLGVPRHPVVVRHGAIWLWPGDPLRADPNLIPETRGPGDSVYRMNSAFMDYDVDYQLINDNLCDFSHISYVHEKTFAQGEQGWATSRPNIITSDRGIRFERWLTNTSEPFGVTKDPTDLWSTYEYLVPGILSMSSVVYPAGTATRYASGKPDSSEFDRALHAGFYFQAVTPMTDRTTRYFFAQGPRHCEDPARLDMMCQVAVAAFHEDRQMISAQQANIDVSADLRFGAIVHDRGPGHLRALIANRIKHEGEAHERAR